LIWSITFRKVLNDFCLVHTMTVQLKK
jgi:hypothetical protein